MYEVPSRLVESEKRLERGRRKHGGGARPQACWVNRSFTQVITCILLTPVVKNGHQASFFVEGES